jgi:rfaE bifunctional protein nucleotidyltransferase chain/domain
MKSAHKIVDWRSAQEICAEWRNNGLKVVFTNGCFDILHRGHIQYLEEASDLGDKLVVGINSDASTQRLKGPRRPINKEQSRAYLIASLTFVDLAVIFGQDTPLELIKTVKPDVLVKGGDYAIDQIVGADFVVERGGVVRVLPYTEGFSTTSIEEKIIALGKRDTKS